MMMSALLPAAVRAPCILTSFPGDGATSIVIGSGERRRSGTQTSWRKTAVHTRVIISLLRCCGDAQRGTLFCYLPFEALSRTSKATNYLTFKYTTFVTASRSHFARSLF